MITRHSLFEHEELAEIERLREVNDVLQRLFVFAVIVAAIAIIVR